MSKDNNIPLCYQITVSNITKIGDRVMSDFYAIFKSAQKNQNTWQSPLIHGKLTKDNTNFPWNFIVDNPKLTVEFCELDDKNKKGLVVGSTPLLLMKKEGEEQFLIFGCNEQNRGRKVAQVQFSYCQCSLARSSNSDQNKDKKINTQKSVSDSNRRIELQFSSDATVEKQLKQQHLLKVIPEQQQYIQEQTLREDQFNNKNENYQTINPSQLETLQFTYRNQKSVSQNDLEMLKEMEDTTDKWYRSNFGKNRPTNLENIDFQHQTSDIKVKYQPNFQKLNRSQIITHIQLQNILANLDKRPKSIEFYGIQLENERMKKTKIVTVQCGKSYNKNWKMLVRLPVESRGYGLQIITDQNQKLYCMIVNDGQFDKHKVDVYDQAGEMVGNLLYNLKLIKTMQVQTLDIVLQQPVVQNQNQKYQNTINEQLNKSFIKSGDPLSNANIEKSQKLKKESYLISKLEEKTHLSLKLQNQAYFQKYKNQIDQQSPKATKKIDYNIPSQKKTKLTPKGKIYETQNNILKYMNNQPYIGKTPHVKSNFRKNQYEFINVKNQSPDVTHQEDASSIIEPQTHKALSEQNKRTKVTQKIDKLQFPSEKNMRNSQEKQKQSYQTINRFEKIQLKSKDPIKIETQSKRSQFSLNNQEQETKKNNLQTKIEAIKKIVINLQKYSRPLSPYSSYRDQNISKNQHESQSWKVQFPSQEKQRPKVSHKKTYREPINVTPCFTSLSNLKFSKHFHIKTENLQKVQQNSPLKRKLKITDNNKVNKVKNLLKNDNLPQFQKAFEKNNKSLRYQHQSLQKQLGVNTDRIALVKNVLQTSYKPQIYTQKKSNQGQKQKNNFAQDLRIYKEEVRSNFDSLINQNDNQNHHTKYSSQTIQPVTNQAQLNFLIITISVKVFQTMFGIKYLRVFVPNKYHYQTQRIKSTSNLVWQCNDIFFNRITPQQNLYIELLSQSTNNLVKIGKAKVSAVQFKHSKKQGVIRSYLIREDEVVGELLLTFKNASKNSNQLIDDQFLSKKRNHTTHQRKSEEIQQKQTQKNKTPPKQSKSLKKSKSKGKKKSESLTQILKNKKKEETNRLLINESSRANIDSRVNPIRQKKFEGGRNIIIGRHSRFPTSEQEEYHKSVPGPGAYDVKTEFRKYI